MMDTSLLASWENFYVIIGSSAAALTGLMFVVITLISSRQVRLDDPVVGISTFSTPTVVHFAMAFFIAALASVPWHSFVHIAIAEGIVGLGGLVYMLRIHSRVGRMIAYKPDLEDWTFVSVLPFLAYATVFVGALLLARGAALALFAQAAAVLSLIAIGIHNAWDVVTYLVVDSLNSE